MLGFGFGVLRFGFRFRVGVFGFAVEGLELAVDDRKALGVLKTGQVESFVVGAGGIPPCIVGPGRPNPRRFGVDRSFPLNRFDPSSPISLRNGPMGGRALNPKP